MSVILVDEQTRNTIIHRWHCGQSQRQIARGLSISRNTIKSILNDVQRMREGVLLQDAIPSPKKKRSSLLDPYDEQIRQSLDRSPYTTIVNLHAQLCANGYQGSYTILRDRVKQIRQASLSKGASPDEFVHAAARVTYCQVEIELAAGGRQSASLFTYRLTHSGRVYVQFCAGRDLVMTLVEHVCAFEHFGGVAVSAQYHSVPLIVDRVVEREPVFNSTFLRFASHYGFRPLCLVGEEDSEDPFGDFLHQELATQILQKNRFRSLHHANDELASWVAEVADNLSYRGSRPIDLYQNERRHQIPLPGQPWCG